ncbi:MAG: molybdate ABC transporter substrate-binding protein [Dysosmobacter sp.]|nr:molybdate ABC transporter substrate-binding protein [Dysosmobacter sp.]
MKKYLSLVLALCLALSLTACGGSKEEPAQTETPAETAETAAEPVEITVFAAASMQESLDAAIEQYKSVAPEVTVVMTYDSSGTLLTQIKEGASCDLFISAAPKQMNALDGSLKDDAEKNPDGLDYIVEGSRIDLLENKVTLAVPEGNPAGIESFDQLAELLKNGNVTLAIGNSDVPVGQYTQKIFAYYEIDEAAIASKLTYGSNVKEVTTQVSEGSVDCGIIYGTDAFSAGLTVVDGATAEMCGQVIYPAAVLNCGEQPEAAQAFLDYLCTADALACFEGVGFSPLV